MSSFEIKSRDGLRLAATRWIPQGSPKAVVAIIHGLGEHHHRYDHVANFYLQHNIAVYSMDLRGHGQSEGKRGHTTSFDAFLSDIELLLFSIREHFTDQPIILYGHSMGGNLSLNYLLNYPATEIKAAIITSPWLILSIRPSKFQITLAGIMNKIYPAFTNSNGLDVNTLSRDERVGKAYTNDPLVHDKISAKLFKSCYDYGLKAIEQAKDLKTPTLLMHGTEDQLTSHEGSIQFAAQAGEMVTLKLWEGFRHETHNEIGKEEVLEYQLNWLTNNL